MHARCRILIVMGKTDPDGADLPAAVDGPRARATRPGVTVVRNLPVFGYTDPEGHAEVRFEDVRVPGREPHRRRGRRAS